MSAQIFYNNGSSSSEIITHLVNASDGAGLHFDGTSGYIDIPGSGSAPVVGLGTKFSFEFIVQASSYSAGANSYFVDFSGSGARFVFANSADDSGNLAIFDGTAWRVFSPAVKVVDDLVVHHLVVTVSGSTATLYDNGNQIATATGIGAHNIDGATDANIGRSVSAHSYFNGTLYRTRFWNRDVSADVQSLYESASIDSADQWGVATNKITGAVDKNWGTNQADSGNDANDRATFNTNYAWNTDGNITDISVASNVLQFTSASSGTSGLYYPVASGLVSGKRYRLVVRTGAISGGTFKVKVWQPAPVSGYYVLATLTASSTNVVDFILPSPVDNFIYINTTDATATIQLNAASVSIELVAAGVVADFDLSYANPTQSTIVQNRSGSGDATAAGGVTQISPIEQLNTKAIAVGTAAVTPGDARVHIKGADSSVGFVHENASGVKVVTLTTSSLGFVGTHTNHTLKLLVNNDGKVTITAAGNVGVGVAPEAWQSSRTALQIGGNGSLNANASQAAGGHLDISQNAYINSSGTWSYISTDEASLYNQVGGGHTFKYAASGAADAAITWTDALTISSTGLVQVSSTPSDTVGTVGFSLKDASENIEFGLRLDAASKDLHIDRYYAGAWHGPVMSFDRSTGTVIIPRVNDSAPHLSLTQAEGSGRTYNLIADDAGNFVIRDDATGRVTITSAGLVGVGVVPSNLLSVEGTVDGDYLAEFKQGHSTAGESYGVNVCGGTNASDQAFRVANQAESTLLIIRGDGLATFSNGINLGNVASATETTLDGYSEGTWTAGLSGTTAAISDATGRYVRIGSLVWISWYSGGLDLASSANAAKITGLPYNVGSFGANYTAFTYQHGDAVDGNSVGGYFKINTTEMIFTDVNSTNSATFVDGNPKYIMVSGVYQTFDAF